MKAILIVIGIIILVAGAGAYIYFSQTANIDEPTGDKDAATGSALTQAEAIVIAGSSDCTGVGALSDDVYYNENSHTWWIDLERMPELENDGCNPACVVSEETKTAEVNWRCTGLIPPESSISTTKRTLEQLFGQKYPTYADSVTVSITQEDESHARGNVIFVTGEPGGLFLATKIDGAWQIVHDGNGEIPCSLAEYGFPEEMISDCAE